jgi:hypothetical protein
MPKLTLQQLEALRKKYAGIKLAKLPAAERLKRYNQVFASLGGKKIFPRLPPGPVPVTLTPAAPSSGASYLNLGTAGGDLTWDARATTAQPTGIIYTPDAAWGNLLMAFETKPGTKYIMELQVGQASEGLSISWTLLGWEGEINSTIAGTYNPTTAQNIIVGFNATTPISNISLGSVPHYDPEDLIRGGQVGLFFSATLTELSA